MEDRENFSKSAISIQGFWLKFNCNVELTNDSSIGLSTKRMFLLGAGQIYQLLASVHRLSLPVFRNLPGLPQSHGLDLCGWNRHVDGVPLSAAGLLSLRCASD